MKMQSTLTHWTPDEISDIQSEIERLIPLLRPDTEVWKAFVRDGYVRVFYDDNKPYRSIAIRQPQYGFLGLYVTWSGLGDSVDIARLATITDGSGLVWTLNYDWKQQVMNLLGDHKLVRYYEK